MSDQVAVGLAPPSFPAPCAGMVVPAEPPRPAPGDRWRAWDRFVEATPESGFMQSSWWADFRSTCGFENFAVALKDRGNIVGGAVVLKYSVAEGQCFYYIQDGPVLPSDPLAAEEVYGAILEAIEEQRRFEPLAVSHLRIEPRWLSLPAFVSGFRAIPPLADRFLEARDTRCIDLRPSEDLILAQMKPKGRYNIRVAQRHGVRVAEDSSATGLAKFLELYGETACRQEITPKPDEYFADLVAALTAAQRGTIFLAEYQGTPLAAALVVFFGARATYFFGGSLDAHREVMAPYLLHFEIMRRAKAQGGEWYDLWGIAPPNEPDHPWQNFTAFKAKFGGAEVHLAPTLDYVFDPAAYNDYLAAAV